MVIDPFHINTPFTIKFNRSSCADLVLGTVVDALDNRAVRDVARLSDAKHETAESEGLVELVSTGVGIVTIRDVEIADAAHGKGKEL